MRIVLTFLGLFLGSLSSASAGYTQYWTWKKQPDAGKVKRCIEDMRRVVQSSPVELAGADGMGGPLISESLLTFNQKGKEEEIGEPFVFPGRPGANFCKTNGKAYDSVVVACLLVVMDYFTPEEVSFNSDGKMSDGAWDSGMALYRTVFGKEPNFSKEGGVSGFVKNLNLKPTWTANQLWIVMVLLLLAGALGWYAFHPRPDFQIYFEREGNAFIKGKFPQAHVSAVRTFFKQDLPMRRDALVKGWYDREGRIRLDFSGQISDREQQRVRNFLASLRLKAVDGSPAGKT